MSCSQITIKQGEQKSIVFIYKSAGVVVDMTGSTFLFEVKDVDGNTIISKADGTFDKTDIAIGKVSTTLLSTETDTTPETYAAEIKATLPGSDIDKSETVEFIVVEAITT